MQDFRLDVGVAELSELWYTSFVVPAFVVSAHSGLTSNSLDYRITLYSMTT
jgi:hypothetical protein